MYYYGNKVDAALFVAALLEHSEFSFRLITITILGKSEVFCVLSVTNILSADIAESLAPIYSLTRIVI